VGAAQFLDCDDAYSSGLLSGIPIAKLPLRATIRSLLEYVKDRLLI